MSKAEVSVTRVTAIPKRLGALVIAWAREEATGQLRYILELLEHQRGKSCGCVCISCTQPLTAVNAAKDTWEVRPHFRHPQGGERDSCGILAARAALLAALHEGDWIFLPLSRRAIGIAGLSGQRYEAWIERPSEKVRIREVRLNDDLLAVVVLDDGRRLEVQVTGAADPAAVAGSIPRIIIAIDNAELAELSPEELRARLAPMIHKGSWCGHWPAPDLDAQKLEEARQMASDALDWDDAGSDLAANFRRESLLHLEVKEILHSANRLMIPGWDVVLVEDGAKAHHGGQLPCSVVVESAVLEHRLGRIVPDVVARLANKSELLIEVTVTNHITDERLDRIRQVNLPTLEIDFSCMGGVVSRERLRRLVLDELDGKRWLHHPAMDAAKAAFALRAIVTTQGDETETNIRNIRSQTARQWAQRYVDAVHRHASLRWVQTPSDDDHDSQLAQALRNVENAADALHVYGYPSATDTRLYEFGHTVLERLLSIRLDTGVGYLYDNGWQVINTIMTERAEEAKSWHSLYLIAIQVYQPRLNPNQRVKYVLWRRSVIDDIRAGATSHLRDTIFDDLFALLFPEMADSISRPFAKRERPARLSDPVSQRPELPVEPTETAFQNYISGMWLWAIPPSERTRIAEAEASRARLAGTAVEVGGLLYHLARSHHVQEPGLYAKVLRVHTGMEEAGIMRYLYANGYIKLSTEFVGIA